MAIVTVSRGSYSMGKAVAEAVAERLGYECLSRDVLLEASDQFNIPELKLQRAIEDAPSILDRIGHGKQSYVAYIQSALTRHLCKDNVVYHGLAGHLLLKNVSHVLKVRIIASAEFRISAVMERDKLTRRQAASLIGKLDRQRRKWGRSLYGVDPGDPTLYHLLLSIPAYRVSDAADLICRSTKMKQFKSSDEAKQQLLDLALACQVKAVLVSSYPDVAVVNKFGNVLIYHAASDRAARKLRARAAELRHEVPGINNVEVHAGVSPPDEAV